MKKIVFIFITLLLLVTSCGKKQEENNNNNSTVEEKYEVRFTGVNDELISTISVKKDEKIVYPTAPVVEGYEFVVWEMEVEYTNKDIVIKALYNRFEYTVKFYNNDGIVIDAQTVYHGDSATTPNVDMSIESGAFIGWDTDFSKVTSNLEVKPIYQKHTFIVNFYDALGSIISTQKVEYGESAEKPDNPEKEGAEFLGWSESFNNVTSNLEVYPMFEDRCYERDGDINNNFFKRECEYMNKCRDYFEMSK